MKQIPAPRSIGGWKDFAHNATISKLSAVQVSTLTFGHPVALDDIIALESVIGHIELRQQIIIFKWCRGPSKPRPYYPPMSVFARVFDQSAKGSPQPPH